MTAALSEKLVDAAPQKWKFHNEFLNTYLRYLEESESPRVMHIMSCLAGAAACLGRRVYLPWGDGGLFPNIYVALVGPPGVRKSTAMDIMAGFVKANTHVRFAPDDTGGQRQGLIRAIEGNSSEEMKDLVDEINATSSMTVEALQNLRISSGGDPRDEHCLFIAASEFNSLLGSNALDLLPLFNKGYDGDDYKYMLKKDEMVLHEPLLTMIGCTTPTNIATALPAEAIGQGFTSRILLVFGNKKHKKVPRLPPRDPELKAIIGKKFNDLFYSVDGIIRESDKASRLMDELYDETIEIHDHRFTYYCERRHTQLYKLSILFTILRGSYTMDEEDITEASILLRAIEQYMPDAFGEYGLSKLATSKQKLIEFLRSAAVPVRPNILYAMMGKDMSFTDFRNTIADLMNAGKVKLVNTADGEAYMYIDKHENDLDAIIAELVEKGQAVPMHDNVISLQEKFSAEG